MDDFFPGFLRNFVKANERTDRRPQHKPIELSELTEIESELEPPIGRHLFSFVHIVSQILDEKLKAILVFYGIKQSS